MARPKMYDDALRHALIDGAARVMAKRGVDGLALRALAAEHGTSTNAIYAMFGGKPGLVEAVCVEAESSFARDQRAAPVSDDTTADLLALGTAYRRWALANPALYTVMFGGEVPPGEAIEQLWLGGRSSLRPLEDLVARGLASGELRGDHEAITISIWASVHGFVTLEMGLLSTVPEPVRSATYEAHLEGLRRAWMGSTADPAARSAARSAERSATGSTPPADSTPDGPGARALSAGGRRRRAPAPGR